MKDAFARALFYMRPLRCARPQEYSKLSLRPPDWRKTLQQQSFYTFCFLLERENVKPLYVLDLLQKFVIARIWCKTNSRAIHSILMFLDSLRIFLSKNSGNDVA